MISALEQAKQLIRSSDGLREDMQKNNGYPNPFIFEVKNGLKHLLFYGSKHIHDPNNPIFNEIKFL